MTVLSKCFTLHYPARAIAKSQLRICMFRLGVLPGIRLSVWTCDCIERTNASRAEIYGLDVGEDLIDIIVVGRTCNQSALVLQDGVRFSRLSVQKMLAHVTAAQFRVCFDLRSNGPAACDTTFSIARVSDGVLHSTRFAVNVHLLASRDH